MRTTALLKIAGLAVLVSVVGAATSATSDATSDRATLDGIPPVALAGAELRADADDSGRVIAELRVGERVVRGSYTAAEVERWADEADSLTARGGEGRLPALQARDGQTLVLTSGTVRGAHALTLHAATSDSLIRVHASVADVETAPVIGTMRHAARVARAVKFVTAR